MKPSHPSFAPLITFTGICGEEESDTEKGLADFVEIEVVEMENDGLSFDDDLEPMSLSCPVGNAGTYKSKTEKRYIDGGLSTKG